MDITTLSSRGQVVIPKPLRDAHQWSVGTSFSVEILAEGILLKPLHTFAPTTLEEVAGCLDYKGPTLSQQDIDAALQADIQRNFR